MLKLTIVSIEQYDEEKGEFIPPKQHTLQLEHSLVSLSKWESKWCKAFLSKENKTMEETIDYIKCMTITQNVDPDAYKSFTEDNLNAVRDYIDAPMTATIFKKENKPMNKEIITAELIYYWMIGMEIPFECQKWHLTRLLTLINVCNVKSKPAKKSSVSEIQRRNTDLNAARLQALNTEG